MRCTAPNSFKTLNVKICNSEKCHGHNITKVIKVAEKVVKNELIEYLTSMIMINDNQLQLASIMPCLADPPPRISLSTWTQLPGPSSPAGHDIVTIYNDYTVDDGYDVCTVYTDYSDPNASIACIVD